MSAITKEPIETLVRSLIKPFPVNREEAMGEKSVRVHAIEMRKNSAMFIMFITFVAVTGSTYQRESIIPALY